MMKTFDSERYDAFARLLARPDPRDLPRRTHICQCEGDPDRRATRLPGILMGWLQRRHLEIDVEEPVAPATRTLKRAGEIRGLASQGRPANPGLRVLRPTGTG
jgi:hypothetical protein